ncbi:MAG: hypothetical protein RLZZ459_1077, partial [Cyanobacteriota bacterium]|jgi:hypothetical protein
VLGRTELVGLFARGRTTSHGVRHSAAT